MLRFFIGLLTRILLLAGVVTVALMSFTRATGSRLALQYGQFFPPEDLIFFHYVDVDHALNVRQKLPLDVVSLSSSSVSPDGSQRVTAVQNADSADLFIVQADGTRQHIARLSHYLPAPSQGGRKISTPEWSPDGRWITFVTLNPNGSPELYILRPDGSAIQHIDRISERGAAMLPRWVRMVDGD